MAADSSMATCSFELNFPVLKYIPLQDNQIDKDFIYESIINSYIEFDM